MDALLDVLCMPMALLFVGLVCRAWGAVCDRQQVLRVGGAGFHTRVSPRDAA